AVRGSLNLQVHFHTLVLDGVFVRAPDGTLHFHAAVPPTDADVRRVVTRVRRRLERLALAGVITGDEDVDPLADESAALAGLSQAAVLGRAALGSRAGRGPLRIGADPDAPWVDCHVPLHAHDAGFDLHAAVHVAAGDRPRLERLCRYLVRPPLAQHRVQRLRDGRIAVALQRPWADGTTHLCSAPRSSWSVSSHWCRDHGSTCSSIMGSWPRTHRGAERWWRARTMRTKPTRPRPIHPRPTRRRPMTDGATG